MKIADTDEAAGEKTTKRISRQNLHRRLRRLRRKLDDVRVMFDNVASAACIDNNRAAKRESPARVASRTKREEEAAWAGCSLRRSLRIAGGEGFAS